MTQTPITKAIQYVKEELLSNEDNTIRQSARHAIQILTDLLPYERETIEAAYSNGVNDEAFGRLLGSVADNSQDYFTKTFTDNEPHSK